MLYRRVSQDHEQEIDSAGSHRRQICQYVPGLHGTSTLELVLQVMPIENFSGQP
jgi:hypothetical protein